MFNVMLATACKDVSELSYPVMVSPKLDGVRAIVQGGVVLSRSLKPIPNKKVQRDFNHLEGLDGELIVGAPTAKNCFNATSSVVMSHDDLTRAIFYVFDRLPIDGELFSTRQKSLQRLTRPEPNCFLLVQTLVKDVASLMRMEKSYVRQGYEGLMVRALDGQYKHGRSTLSQGWLLKVKRFEDAEALIVGFNPLQRNDNEAIIDNTGHHVRSTKKEGMTKVEELGAFQVVDEAGRQFDIGSGFTAEQRVDYWQRREELKGKLVKYKHQPHGRKDLPRFPVFIGFRSPLDTSSNNAFSKYICK